MKMTITEALSEVNLIKKKITSQQEKIKSCLTRPKHLKDAFEKDGGSEAVINASYQSLNDLYSRLERIRGAISDANLSNSITIGETSKTIFDWLTWKREIAAAHLNFVVDVVRTTKNTFDQHARNPQVYKDEEGKQHLLDIHSNIDMGEWLRRSEALTEMTERLDGQLSLKNATITISI